MKPKLLIRPFFSLHTCWRMFYVLRYWYLNMFLIKTFKFVHRLLLSPGYTVEITTCIRARINMGCPDYYTSVASTENSQDEKS